MQQNSKFQFFGSFYRGKHLFDGAPGYEKNNTQTDNELEQEIII